jgi:hypothetical protein
MLNEKNPIGILWITRLAALFANFACIGIGKRENAPQTAPRCSEGHR